jgi:nicotinate-nucleotide adenylyltransferase
MKKKTIGLLFGSFNPVHTGHLALANYFLEFSELDEVRFVVSPHNPLKDEELLLPASERLKMMQMAVEDVPGLSVSDEEFYLPKPSYTVDTLKFFSQKYPDDEFILIIGEDNLVVFDQWKDYQYILDHYKIYVYNRSGSTPSPFSQHPNVTFFQAPFLDISSSFIRQAIREGKDVRRFLPEKVYEHLIYQRDNPKN